MGLFHKKNEPGGGLAVQIREGGRHPFGVLDGYVPLRQGARRDSLAGCAWSGAGFRTVKAAKECGYGTVP